jgi:hypothetical protein
MASKRAQAQSADAKIAGFSIVALDIGIWLS